MNTSETQAAYEVKFLVGEDRFLDQVIECLDQLQSHKVGSRIPDDALKTIERLNQAVTRQMNERLAFREHMAAIKARGNQTTVARLYPENAVQEQVRQLRQRVIQKTTTTQQKLRTTMLQLAETQVIVTAVLETVLGVTQDGQQYDADGRPVRSVATAKSVRVA